METWSGLKWWAEYSIASEDFAERFVYWPVSVATRNYCNEVIFSRGNIVCFCYKVYTWQFPWFLAIWNNTRDSGSHLPSNLRCAGSFSLSRESVERRLLIRDKIKPSRAGHAKAECITSVNARWKWNLCHWRFDSPDAPDNIITVQPVTWRCYSCVTDSFPRNDATRRLGES